MVPPPVFVSPGASVLPVSPLPSSHFLSQPRQTAPTPRTVDTSTLNAHDFDVDNRTGFMPFEPPLARLPSEYEAWEVLLDEAQAAPLQLGRRSELTQEQRDCSATWRARIRELPIILTTSLHESEVHLRRAHSVLAWLMHFYIHSQPPPPPELARADVVIPAPIAVPLITVSEQLQLPVVLTYSDDVLYNWALKKTAPTPSSPARGAPSLDNLRCITLFTGTSDEEEFYLSSARCELVGVAALEAMRATMDELFVGDSLARLRIERYLTSLSGHIDELAKQLLAVREGCDPEAFYHDIRPWFNGQDSGPDGRKWVFEGVPRERQPSELSGPSAGQSSLVHALDIFLGVSDYSHGQGAGDRKEGPTFLDRMQIYMPRHHRAFLRHLANAPRPLRELVEEYQEKDSGLADAYNRAVGAMKRFRDAHMRIVALYIMGPARREREAQMAAARPLKGTGGTDLVSFLKGVRDRTAAAIFQK
ncbi:tryptophan 2,3-dioxygenase [Vararia minispora EC-137]|uniref:Tryptophan 2,3-dioxygenase n=1 Tax=Vararia minispora EC-137 TaxID=1314806 RepID=A0ACB8QU47_9AGAM|nr:tryptophan 2,3-dioxygenase [Vararia minispora EC-137]